MGRRPFRKSIGSFSQKHWVVSRKPSGSFRFTIVGSVPKGPITVRQNLRLVELAFVPYWPDSMDYMFRGQTESRRFYCLSRLAGAAEIVEIPVKFWACGSVRARLCNRADRLARAFDNKTHFILIGPVGSPTSLNSDGRKSVKRPFAAEKSRHAGPPMLLCRISTS